MTQAPQIPQTPQTVLLLPGLDGTDIFFEPLLRQLQARLPAYFTVRVWPLPAQGPQDYDTLLAALSADIASMPACWLLGWSFSGPLALMLAAAEPDRVRGVILAASFVRPPRLVLRLLGGAVRAPGLWAWRVLRRLPLWLLRPPADALRQAKDRTWREVRPALLAARLREVARVDVRSELGALQVPVMYIASAQDGVVPPRALQEILRLRADVRVVTIAGPHQSLYSHASEAVAPIIDFLGAAA